MLGPPVLNAVGAGQGLRVGGGRRRGGGGGGGSKESSGGLLRGQPPPPPCPPGEAVLGRGPGLRPHPGASARGSLCVLGGFLRPF